MRFSVAQEPGPEQSQDRVFLARDAVVMLDGASSRVPAPVAVDAYVDVLGRSIAARMDRHPHTSLRELVADAIAHTVARLGLEPGNSPSSTVAILRRRENTVELYVLGDGAIYYGLGEESVELVDQRLGSLKIPEQAQYRNRLANGCGFDSRHRELLQALQERQSQLRNSAEGYWIAEATPQAAYQGYCRKLAMDDISWAVLATDGAYEAMEHLGLADWPRIAQFGDDRLAELLGECRRWEMDTDPDAMKFPRAKLTDDKTVVAVRLQEF